VLLTLSLYLLLFVAIAVFSGQLIRLLEPVLRKGPYLHALMAAGMIAWGIYLLRSQKSEKEIQGSRFKVRDSKSINSLLLLVPCPVCLSAMTFSTWAALGVIKLPSLIVGIGLGLIFALLTLAIVGLTRIKQTSSQISLGLSMIAIGFYFLASLYLPAKIEEAKGVYRSFIPDGNNVDMSNGIGMFVLLFLSLIIGYFAHKRMEVKG